MKTRTVVAGVSAAGVAGLLALGLISGASPAPPAPLRPDVAMTTAPRTVERVIDGDTIRLADGATVRLLEVDTPEIHKPGTPVQCYGPEAAAHVRELLPTGTLVTLELEREHYDRYGRLLANVYRSTDGLWLEQELVASGFARVRTYRPNTRYEKWLRYAEEQARKDHLGLWGACQ